MIKVFLIVMACLEPNYTACQRLTTVEVTGPDPMYWCLLNRPRAAMLWQLQIKDGWITFTQCQLVNTEKNGRLG